MMITMTRGEARASVRTELDREVRKIERSACLSTQIACVPDAFTRKTFETGLCWLEDFIMKPHAELGRRGAVCPFAKPVHHEESLVFCLWDATDLHYRDYLSILGKFPDLYLRLLDSAKADSRLFSLCVFVRGLDEAQFYQYIDEAHALLKPAFMDAGLMLGEFHPLSVTKGAHSETFRPMRSSQPAFVVRAMSSHDALFIDRESSADEVRLRELRNYRSWVGENLPEAEVARIEKRIAELGAAGSA
ncbi:hypothetical protein PWP93_23155 [Paraburkholderia sp. A1RI-2L]|uniref:DUF6875 domain-containing protein n=1 Tax=Paraburkholderia sp. A1RI-2L TaxID=3028367 RepID=UPI003B7A9B3A